MRPSTLETRHRFAKVRNLACRLALLVIAAGLLSGCETTGPGPTALSAQASKPPEPPMTRSRAAEECWMKTEKGSAAANLDKRADVVTKCIDDKLRTAQAAPRA
jgi:hypothetical protein